MPACRRLFRRALVSAFAMSLSLTACSRSKEDRCESALRPYYEAYRGLARRGVDPSAKYAEMIAACRESWSIELLECIERETLRRRGLAPRMSKTDELKCSVLVEKAFGSSRLHSSRTGRAGE
jgi:hypothetical protein